MLRKCFNQIGQKTALCFDNEFFYSLNENMIFGGSVVTLYAFPRVAGIVKFKQEGKKRMLSDLFKKGADTE